MAVKRRKNPASVVESHPLNQLDFLPIEIWREDESRAWVTCIPSLNRLSDYGGTEEEALDRTAAAIKVYLDGVEEDGAPVPYTKAQIKRIREAVAEAL